MNDAVKPKQIGHFKTGSTGTHRNFYDGGNLVHAAAGAPGLTGKIYRIVDIADPSEPREVGRFSLPEQEKGAATNGLKFSCHGPAHIEGDRAYLSYGDGGGIILDVEDMSQPKLISQIAFRGITATQGIHIYLPLPRRNIALINDEAIRENGDENFNMAGIVDISDEKRPRMLSLFPLPEPRAGKRAEEFLRESRPLRPTQSSSSESSSLSRRSRRHRLSDVFQRWTASLRYPRRAPAERNRLFCSGRSDGANRNSSRPGSSPNPKTCSSTGAAASI